MDKLTFTVKGRPLIKFQKSDRIMSFRDGCLHANTLEFYRKLEAATGDVTIGDGHEAMLHIHEGFLRFPDTGEEIVLNDALIPTSHSTDYVFCMFGIDPSLESFVFNEEQKAKMRSFGDTALVILDSEEFIKRVSIAAEKQGYRSYFNYVSYYDPSVDNGNMIISLFQDMENVAFWKRNIYSYQQEARFIFTSDSDIQSVHI